MDMTDALKMSLYDLMEADGILPDEGLVLLAIKNGAGLVRSDTGKQAYVDEIRKGGFFEVPNTWDRTNLLYHDIMGIAKKHMPREGADFCLPLFEGDLLSGIQYYKERKAG